MECVSGATTPISGDSIRVHLEKILASRRFVQSARLKRFLRFSVEEALAGRAENLKEYTLALEVFDKAASHAHARSCHRLRIPPGRDTPLAES
jgi:hypothetical protein